jgi:co-chaperonin GroES (HSP10)
MKARLKNVIIEPIKEEIKDSSGLITGVESDHKFSKGKVISIGEMINNLEVGEIAWYDKHRSNNIKLNGESFDIMDISNIFVTE